MGGWGGWARIRIGRAFKADRSWDVGAWPARGTEAGPVGEIFAGARRGQGRDVVCGADVAVSCTWARGRKGEATTTCSSGLLGRSPMDSPLPHSATGLALRARTHVLYTRPRPGRGRREEKGPGKGHGVLPWRPTHARRTLGVLLLRRQFFGEARQRVCGRVFAA